jgi:flagellar hook protein FlgE
MMRSLFAGVSGLRNHQTEMDVIGNNIANVNTVAFKASRVVFKEAFAQLLQGASRPPGNTGGINPIQIGSGMNIGSIDQLFTQGSLSSTGQNTDLAIQGDGFFVLSDGQKKVYTRAGNFQLDANGRLIAPNNGFVVQGINADSFGNFNAASSITDIVLPLGQKSPPQATSDISLTGNLDQNAEVGTEHAMGITVYDGAGAPHSLQITFTNTAPGAWDWTATIGGTSGTVASGGSGTATFSPSGSLLTFTGGDPMTIDPGAAGGGDTFDVAINPGTINGIDGLAGFAKQSNAVVSGQNGYQAGDLTDISVDKTGVITGFFTNGVSRSLAQISLASFNNPSGLLRAGDNIYTESANSGLAVVGFAGVSNTSTLTPGALENSNVDISQEFTNMIIAQRGFQANARVITTSDEMLQELVNLRR